MVRSRQGPCFETMRLAIVAVAGAFLAFAAPRECRTPSMHGALHDRHVRTPHWSAVPSRAVVPRRSRVIAAMGNCRLPRQLGVIAARFDSSLRVNGQATAWRTIFERNRKLV